MVYRVAESSTAYRRLRETPVTGPADIAALVQHIVGRRQEFFLVVLLDGRHCVIRRVTVSKGTVDAALVHPRDVFREAVRRNAKAIVLAHNHPSGCPEPSREDRALTARLAQVGAVVGVEVLDHVIVAKEGYVSLRERGIGFGEGGEECSSQAASTRSGR